MNQFRIKGIDYPDDSLQHGIGKGSGRGRPVGSKNGQVMPGAAYMKDYKIVGHKAEEDLTSSGAAQKNYTTERGLRTVGSVNRNQQARAQQERVNRLRSQNAQRTQQARTTAPVSRPATPSEKIDAGKELINKGFKWSAKNVNDAGGIQSRAGRQIIYENPTLSDDYKKQVAKKYGDSDGRSYPKAASTPLVGGPTQANISDQANSINTVDNPNDWQRRERADTVGRRDARYVNADAGHTAPITSAQATSTSTPASTPARTARPEQRITEDIIREQTIPEQRLTEDIIREQAPANAQQQETPEQKSLWDSVGGWFSQAGKDIGDAASSAWNTVSGAASDASKWVGDRLGEAGEWAGVAAKDLSDWVGDRANEFNTWLNGQQVVVADRNGPNLTSYYEYQPGVLGNAGRWLGDTANNVGQWVGNAANDVGQTVNNVAGDIGRGLGNWWNGRDVEVNRNGRWVQGHEAGARENIGNALGDIGRAVGGAANAAGQLAGNVAGDVGRGIDRLWNGRDVEVNQNGRWVQGHEPGIRENIGNTLNDARQWAGARAQDVSNFVNGVQPGTLQGAPYWDVATGQYVDPSMPSLAERFGNAANDVGQWLGNTANAGGQWLNNNVVAPVTNAANGVVDFVRNTANDVGNRVATGAATNRALSAGVAPSEVEQMQNMVSNGTMTPDAYNNYMNNLAGIQEVERASAQTGWDGVPADVAAMNQRENNPVGEFVRNVGNDASNWWNGTSQNIGNAFNSAGQMIGNFANASGQWLNDNVAVPAANAADTIRNWAGETAQNVRDTADVAGLAGRAIAAGVPMDLVSRWTQNYNNGQISPGEFEDLLDRWTSSNR